MMLLFSPIKSEFLTFAVKRDEVVIAELSFASEYFVISTPGCPLEPAEFSCIAAYIEMRLGPWRSAAKAAKTRKDRQLLRGLYALEDTRKPMVDYCPDDSVNFFERLYGLKDLRESDGLVQADRNATV